MLSFLWHAVARQNPGRRPGVKATCLQFCDELIHDVFINWHRSKRKRRSARPHSCFGMARKCIVLDRPCWNDVFLLFLMLLFRFAFRFLFGLCVPPFVWQQHQVYSCKVFQNGWSPTENLLEAAVEVGLGMELFEYNRTVCSTLAVLCSKARWLIECSSDRWVWSTYNHLPISTAHQISFIFSLNLYCFCVQSSYTYVPQHCNYVHHILLILFSEISAGLGAICKKYIDF